MTFEEYVPKNQVRLYPEHYIMGVVKDLKLNFGVQYHIDNHAMMHYEDDYIEHIKKSMSSKFGLHALEEGKFDIKTWDSSTHMGRTMQMETIIMTKQDLYTLLGRFNIGVKMPNETR